MSTTTGDSGIDVRVTKLVKHFGDGDGRRVAIHQLSLTIESGQLVTIVGPSGCGKTTLLRIIAGLEKQSEGDVWRRPERTVGRTTYVHQFPRLLPWRTMLQNVALGVELKNRITPGRLDYIQALIDQFGLRGFEAHYPAELSGGMQQRVALIRALASSPGLMLCDEPFSSIDFVNRLALSATFRAQCKVFGITTMLVTHNIDEAILLGDVIYVMSGRPGMIKATYRPVFPGGRTDAIASRSTPEFVELFSTIWKDLEP